MALMTKCPYCGRPLAGVICPAHGDVGAAPPPDTSGTVPRGGIIMWSGSASAVPTSWALCDGTNGTPDLRDRFILAAGSTYGVGTSGGAATHTHSDHSAHAHDAGTLAVSAHSGTNVSAHSDTSVWAHDAHTHELPFIPGTASIRYISGGTGSSLTPTHGVAVSEVTSAAARAVSSAASIALGHTVEQPANHTITQPATHSVSGSSGSYAAQSHASASNLVPYYCLAFIHKL